MRPLNETLRDAADTEGFAMLGIAPAIESAGIHSLLEWIRLGYAGEMGYVESRKDAYRHPSAILDGVRSLVVLTYPYAASPFPAIPPAHGKVARYAWSGTDYHDVIHPKLKRLCNLITEAHPGSRARGVIDTAPLLEREVAQQAGLGWRGKNTLLLNRHHGSYFFLACLLTDVALAYDAPQTSTHCGTCIACLEACPTDAFPQPGVLDARRCISYLTIEHRGPIPIELRPGIGDWVFGCDVCQEVCPWNRKPSRVDISEADDGGNDLLHSIDLRQLFLLNEETFRERFRNTPLWRPRRRGMLRNAAIVLGNQADPDSIRSLKIGLVDVEPIVRGASAWALGRIESPLATIALRERRPLESDPMVRDEIDAALGSR